MKSDNRKSGRTCLGKIATAHGIRGLVKVLVFGEEPGLLDGTLYTDETGPACITLRMKNSMGKYWLAEIDGVADRNSAEALRGTALWIERDALPAPDEGAFYYDDLAGMIALDEAGLKIGTVLGAENFGAGDLLEIQPLSGESFFIPFNDDYVPKVDLDAGTLTIKNTGQFTG